MKMQVMTKYFFMFFIFLVIALCAPETSYSEDSGVADPRTVRLIYFLPTDSQFEADMPKKIREEVRKVQAFYADQMEAHGYGKRTFRVETDEQGEMIVHRLNGKHALDHYRNTRGAFLSEVNNSFDSEKIDCIISGTDEFPMWSVSPFVVGKGGSRRKKGGYALVLKYFVWPTLAHELGHAFGLSHDFRKKNNLMAHGTQSAVLSPCSAKFLSMHTYFNSEIPLEEGELPTVELLSALQYPEGAESFPVRLRVSDPNGVSQVHLSLQSNMIACRELEGEKDAVVEFDYRGVFLTYSNFIRVVDRLVHTLDVRVINTAGDISLSHFYFAQTPPYYMDTFKGHKSAVFSVSFSHDSTILGSALRDGTAQLWDVQSRSIIRTFSVYTYAGQVTPILFSPTNPHLAFVTSSWKIKLLDIKTGGIIQTFSGHTGGIAALAFSPDGRTLASGGYDDTVKLWDVETGENLATFSASRHYILSLAFSPDGISLAAGIHNGNILIWDIESREMQKQISSAHNNTITSVSYSLDGKLLASGSSDWKVKLWDAETGKYMRTFDGHNGLVSSVSFLVSGKRKLLISGAHDATVKLWEVDSGANIETLTGAVGQIYSVSVSHDQTIIAAGTAANHIELWDITELQQTYLDRDTEVNIPDPNLRNAVADALGKSADDPIMKEDMQNLYILRAERSSISDLTGLELATNLTDVSLYKNSISVISVLADLTNLANLSLHSNAISDISVLAGLTNLITLSLDNNAISDISVLAGLTNLITLSLDNNAISDISVLAGLTNLRHLSLYKNSISDISALADLTKLVNLDLDVNLISDLSPLIENAASGKKYTLSVYGNRLSYASVHTHIPLLKERGITVYYNRSTHPAVLKVSGDNQEGDTGMPLDHPFVVEVQDEKGVLSPGVSVTFTGTAGGGTLSATTATTDANGRAETTLTLGTTPGKNTVQVTATEITQSVLTFTAITTEGEPVPVVLKVSGDNQEGDAGMPLDHPFVVEVQDEKGVLSPGVSVTFAVIAGGGTLSATTVTTDANGRAETTLTLGTTPGKNTVQATATEITPSVLIFNAIAVKGEPMSLKTDVNDDDAVNIQDLLLVASNFGQMGQNSADVNDDGVVDLIDLLLVAADIESSAAPTLNVKSIELANFSKEEIKKWIVLARQLDFQDPLLLEGVAMLEQLLVQLNTFERIPKETALLPNYPNPFNPETWIPFQLSRAANVNISIYTANGKFVRKLELGHLPAGIYHHVSRAANWDGKNSVGESVASGIYFYRFSTDDFTTTRKMLIRK